ncbi:MAG: arginine--tRNA ligase [Patescibacteria group bacterium]
MIYLDLINDLTQFGIQPELVASGDETLGSDLAMPCFRLAAEYKQSPNEIAVDIAQKISHEGIERAEAINGYVNIWLKPSYIFKTIVTEYPTGDRLAATDEDKGTVVVEYVSQNLAKPLSIGHLRNALQGRAIAKIYEFAGWNVITDSHIGDWGTAFGMWAVGFKRFSSEQALQEGGNEELGRAYVAVRNALKQEAEAGETTLKDEVQDWLIRLESGDSEALDMHSRFSEISLNDGRRILGRLDISHDYELGEAFFYKPTRAILERIINDGTAVEESDGSIVVPLDSEGIDVPALIQKSNGAVLYLSSDIATLEYRQKEWAPDKVIYVVGAEQQFHFKQLFALNSILGSTDAELVHHWYGLVEEQDENGKRKKMSSRTGAVSLEDALNMAVEEASKNAKPEMTADDIEKVAIGALVFREFIQGAKNNVLFDWNDMFSMQGMSGPYIQYSAVRMNSVLEKAGGAPDYSHTYDWIAEKQLLRRLASFEAVCSAAVEEREGCKLAHYLYDLSKDLNRYYEQTHILDDDAAVQASRLWVIAYIRDHMVKVLDLLGIKVPSSM